MKIVCQEMLQNEKHAHITFRLTKFRENTSGEDFFTRSEFSNQKRNSWQGTWRTALSNLLPRHFIYTHLFTRIYIFIYIYKSSMYLFNTHLICGYTCNRYDIYMLYIFIAYAMRNVGIHKNNRRRDSCVT